MSQRHCVYCFDVLCHLLEHEGEASAKEMPVWEHEADPKALFVSWKKYKEGNALRGCLGTFTPRTLGEVLAEYAIASATKDRRFNPITKEELPHLQVAVSFLDDFEHIADRHDWAIGEHGLIMEIQEYRESHSYRATFLPEIAPEQGWTREQTIHNLIKKSGYSGSLELTTIKMTRYRTKHHSLTYPEYVAIKAHQQ